MIEAMVSIKNSTEVVPKKWTSQKAVLGKAKGRYNII